MNWNRKKALAMAGSGVAGVALFVAILVPNTTPVKAPSPLSGLTQQAEAQKPTFSPIAADAVPAGIGNLPDPGATPAQAQPVQVAEAPAANDDGPVPQAQDDTSPAPDDDAPDVPADIAPPPPPAATRPAPPPAEPDDYASRRARWRSAMDQYVQGGQAQPDR